MCLLLTPLTAATEITWHNMFFSRLPMAPKLLSYVGR